MRFLRYGPDKMLMVRVTRATSKVKSRSHYDAHYTTTSQNPNPLWFLRYNPTQYLKAESYYGKVKGQIKVTPLFIVPTKYQLPTPHCI